MLVLVYTVFIKRRSNFCWCFFFLKKHSDTLWPSKGGMRWNWGGFEGIPNWSTYISERYGMFFVLYRYCREKYTRFAAIKDRNSKIFKMAKAHYWLVWLMLILNFILDFEKKTNITRTKDLFILAVFFSLRKTRGWKTPKWDSFLLWHFPVNANCKPWTHQRLLLTCRHADVCDIPLKSYNHWRKNHQSINQA